MFYLILCIKIMCCVGCCLQMRVSGPTLPQVILLILSFSRKELVVSASVADPDQRGSHHFRNLDPDPHQGDMPDPDPHQIKIRVKWRCGSGSA